jgi:hypothetical protein
MKFAEILKTKTFWAALGGLMTVVGTYFAGEAALSDVLNALWQAAMVVFLRHGIAKAGNGE